MKMKVLFVDDDSLVLQGLQRVLYPLSEEWDMEFVESGAKALERMEVSPFDVVVSDMLMPGMNGAELLNRVMVKYPKTVRLILSGHADKELILKCVGSTHQFLSKPCKAETLKATILRASASEKAVQNDVVKRLVAQMGQLPSVPSVYANIIEALQDLEVSVETIGSIIGRDIAMTAQILKLVNSAYFGLRRQVSGPAEAVRYLGLDTIRSLVLSVNVFSQFESVKINGFSIGSLWSHSMQTGAGAKTIAQKEGADRTLSEESFVSGLLHDAGKLVLAANFAEQYSEVIHLMRDEKLYSYEAEQKIFGATHADVGGFLFGLWGLPVLVVEAIALHHRPADAPQKVFSPLTAVHAANALVHNFPVANENSDNNRLKTSYLSELGLTGRLDLWREELKRFNNAT